MRVKKKGDKTCHKCFIILYSRLFNVAKKSIYRWLVIIDFHNGHIDGSWLPDELRRNQSNCCHPFLINPQFTWLPHQSDILKI